MMLAWTDVRGHWCGSPGRPDAIARSCIDEGESADNQFVCSARLREGPVASIGSTAALEGATLSGGGGSTAWGGLVECWQLEAEQTAQCSSCPVEGVCGGMRWSVEVWEEGESVCAVAVGGSAGIAPLVLLPALASNAQQRLSNFDLLASHLHPRSLPRRDPLSGVNPRHLRFAALSKPLLAWTQVDQPCPVVPWASSRHNGLCQYALTATFTCGSGTSSPQPIFPIASSVALSNVRRADGFSRSSDPALIDGSWGRSTALRPIQKAQLLDGWQEDGQFYPPMLDMYIAGKLWPASAHPWPDFVL